MSLSLQPTKVLMNRGIVRERFVLSSFCPTVREHSASARPPAVPVCVPAGLPAVLGSIGNPLCAFSESLAVALSPVKGTWGQLCVPAGAERAQKAGRGGSKSVARDNGKQRGLSAVGAVWEQLHEPG